MRIEAFDRLGDPLKADVSRVVVYDDHDHPIAVAFRYQPDLCYASSFGAPGFDGLLALMNIKQTALVVIDGKELLHGNHSRTTADQLPAALRPS